MSAADLIRWLNPKIRGWSNYHRHVVSKRVFARVDNAIFICLWQWARRRHPKKSPSWFKQKYFEQHGGRNWAFFGQSCDDEGKPHKVRLLLASSTRPYKGTSRSRAPLIPTILPMKPTSKNAKEIIWRERFGGRGLFAFSGGSNADSAPCATPRSPVSQAGAYTIASLVCRVVPRVQTTACCFIQSATTGFIANTFPYQKPRLPERGVRRA